MRESSDPSDLRSVAVTARDVVAAHEAAQRAGRAAVLRVTPPFSGRMRARLHVAEAVAGEEAAAEATPERDGPRPIEIPPGDLLGDPPAYPRPDDTEDALRADPEETFSRERHRERHEAALQRWRERVRGCIVDAVEVETPTGRQEVGVVVLGE